MTSTQLLHLAPPDAAAALLGWTLTSVTSAGQAGGIIVETEAYAGQSDPASHAYRGKTPRTLPMFETAGTIYVYRSYGIHACLNLVTGKSGVAGAVLIRSLEPTVGIELMTTRRLKTNVRLLTTGPGRVGQALGLSTDISGTRLGQIIMLTPPRFQLSPEQVGSTGRIGVSQAANVPWRFFMKGNQFVSRVK